MDPGAAGNRSAPAAAAGPGYYEAFYQMALVNLTLHNAPDAEANLRKSIEVSGDKYADAEVGLGTVLLDPKDDQSYSIVFDRNRFPMSRDLHVGTHVTVTANFDGANYVATAAKVI